MKKEKEKDNSIKIILGRIEGPKGEENYCYLEDTVNQNTNPINQNETQKIKIPLTIYNDNINSNHSKDIINQNINNKEQIIEEDKENEQLISSNENNINIRQKDISFIDSFDEKINYLTPNSASWFKYEDIHPIEMKANQEFFSGKFPSKTRKTYKQFRNFIIDLYKENPEIYLSLTSK
jgi:Ni,Fe-hydrogenase I large subunit